MAGHPGDEGGVLLLVEADAVHAHLLAGQLAAHPDLGLAVVPVGSVVAAVARVAAEDVRCVVLRLALPDARALEDVARLHALDPSLPLVVLTDADGDGPEVLRAGAHDHLVAGRDDAQAVARAVRSALVRAGRHEAEQRQARLGHRLQHVLEASAEGVCWLDPDGTCTYANPAAAELVGLPVEELLGTRLHDAHVCDTEPAACPLVDVLAGRGPDDAGEQVLRRADGSTLVVEVRVRPVAEAGGAGSVVASLTDVTARRQVQQALAESEAQLQEAQRLARVGSWDWDTASGEVVWSAELRRLTGLQDVDGTDAFDRYLALVAPEDRAATAQLFSLTAAEDPPVVVRHRLVRPDGLVRWVQGHMTAAGWDADGAPVRVLGTVQDIHEQKTAEDLLAHQALHDALTGLVNREVLLDRLARLLSARAGDGSLLAVVFLDLDQFKWVNDSRSHSAGDRLLVGVARALQAAVRPTDTLARFGGDEFVVLCEGLHDEDDVLALVSRLSTALEAPFALDDGEVAVSASIGVATARAGDGTDAESLVRDADIAMYRAKERGRARVEVFDEEMRDRATARLETQNDLRAGLQRGELEVHFQPVVDPRTGTVTGTEALARWRHPVRGLLLPEEFIPHAEESGLIVAVGTAMLDEACAVTAAWNRERAVPLQVGVNLSARQLSHPDLPQVVAHALASSGLAPGQLCLEVTETAVMEDSVASGAVLGELRRLGVRVAIDDFGTGYSSLAYLLSLPVDVLKVDRSFVVAVDGGGPGTAIVTAVVALAQTLGLTVVAEGVETTDQRAILLALGVRSAQGWLWGRAVQAGDATWVHDGTPLGAPTPARTVALPPARTPLPSEQHRSGARGRGVRS